MKSMATSLRCSLLITQYYFFLVDSPLYTGARFKVYFPAFVMALFVRYVSVDIVGACLNLN